MEFWERLDQKAKIILILALTNLLSLGYSVYTYVNSKVTPTVGTVVEEEEMIYVDLQGEVQFPNYYEVKRGTRLFELLELAGGVTEEADIYFHNRTIILEDQMKIFIPKVSKTPIGEDGVQTPIPDYGTPTNGLVNINTASKEVLMTLKGIGEVKAQAIIDYRTKVGPFYSKEDLMEVSGIGEKTYDAIEDDICI